MSGKHGVGGWLAGLVGLAALNCAFLLAWWLFRLLPGFYLPEATDFAAWLVCWNLASLTVVAFWLPQAMREKSRSVDQLAGVSFIAGLVLMLFFVACVALGKFAMPGRRRLATLLVLAPLAIFLAQAIATAVANALRGRFSVRRVVFVGDSPAMAQLAKRLAEDRITGETIAFDDAIGYLKSHACDELYCSLVHETLPKAHELFDYCENNLVRFFGVPESSDFLGRNLVMTELDDVPVLIPREEPLRKLSNRVVKRALDLVVAIGFLATLFIPILIVVAVRIKRESPGPVFFRQRRHGLNGREFKCFKFRSMHVNDRSDTAQTAKNDPRKFPFGDFMRRTNIDELPQFINVLLGDMSVVGPRPHPVKLTDDFGDVVNRYRVRLYAKPGVTGWAQVNGARGAALEIGDMIKRVRLDIWYLEHWTFWLDLRIIFETFWQTIRAKNKNAF